MRAVAKYGMKDVSTRSISEDAGVNDAYIYRFFKDKEDLLAQAYLLENDKFMRHVIRRIELVQEQAALQEMRDRYCIIFHTAWRYLLDTPNVCRFFMYYYHSPNFEKYAQEAYKKQLDLLTEKNHPPVQWCGRCEALSVRSVRPYELVRHSSGER